MPAEHRTHERFERRLRVRFEWNGQQRDAVTRNISLGGMFIVLNGDFPPIGSELTVRFRLPALKQDTEAASVVRWTDADGIGIQFSGLRAKEVWALNQLFKAGTP